ncbi:MAG: Gfo/Idh/MocA family protein [Pirellulales bacterium]
MNPTPEQRAVGLENFQTVLGETRRDFLKQGIAATLVPGATLGGFYFGYDSAVDRPLRVGIIGTGDEGSVMIGAINPKFIEVRSIADIRPYSIYRAFYGDCFGEIALKARPGLLTRCGWRSRDEAQRHVKVYGPYQELIANAKADGVEAVIIALPLHLHAPAAIAAMRAGLHVLTEKLMGHSIAECKEMARVAKLTGLHLATGHQRHYSILYENAVDMIRRGLLGDLHCVHAQWHRGNLPGNDSWQPPMPEKLKPQDLQAGRLAKELAAWRKELVRSTRGTDVAETELWRKKIAQREAQLTDESLRDAAKTFGYQDREIVDASGKVVYHCPAAEELLRWRLWDRTGAGLMAELGSHQLDAAGIFIAAAHGGKKQHPLCVTASANRPVFPWDRDIEDHVYAILEFPAPGYDPKDSYLRQKKIAVQYSSINGNGFGGYGETVFGTKATLLLAREQEAMLFDKAAATSKITVEKTKKGPVLDTQASADPVAAAVGKMATAEISRGYAEEQEHWAWCIRNPAPENVPRCHPQVALADAVIALATNLSARQGVRIDFQEAWFDIDRDETPEGTKPDLARYNKA